MKRYIYKEQRAVKFLHVFKRVKRCVNTILCQSAWKILLLELSFSLQTVKGDHVGGQPPYWAVILVFGARGGWGNKSVQITRIFLCLCFSFRKINGCKTMLGDGEADWARYS